MSKYAYLELTLYRKEVTIRILILSSKRNNELEQNMNYKFYIFLLKYQQICSIFLLVRNVSDGLVAHHSVKFSSSHSLQWELIACAYVTKMQKFCLRIITPRKKVFKDTWKHYETKCKAKAN